MSAHRSARKSVRTLLGHDHRTAQIVDGSAIGCLALVLVLLTTPAALADRPDGIDVSHWQGEITPSDWTQAYNAGKVFCFTKATQGDYFTDDEFVDNMEEGAAAGLLMGCYHFADPEYVSAIAEADYFVSIAGDYLTDGYLRPILDLEWGSALSKTALSNWVNDWMDRVEELTGVEPIIYTNTNYATYELNSTVADRDVWIAQWYPSDPETDEPSIGVFNAWVFWQWTDSCSVPGIGSEVDCDVFNGTMAELQNYVIQNALPGDLDDDGDVDLSDFGIFQTCLTGAGNPQDDPDCARAKLEGGDADVDDQDLNKFLGCMSGANIAGNPDCLN